MPYKSEKIKLPESLDRRCKLTEDDRNQIRYLYSTGEYSYRQLAEMFGCSKSNVNIICNPNRAESVKARRKEHHAEYVPDKDEMNRIVREHRRYKNKLYKEGKIE